MCIRDSVWGALGLSKLEVWEPPLRAIYTAAAIPAILGLAYALASVRAKRPWLLMAAVALFANGSLLALPHLFGPELNAAFGR